MSGSRWYPWDDAREYYGAVWWMVLICLALTAMQALLVAYGGWVNWAINGPAGLYCFYVTLRIAVNSRPTLLPWKGWRR